MKSFGLTLILGLLFMPLGHAGKLCEKGQIQELKMGESENLCLKSDRSLNPTQVKTLKHLIQLHQQVARLLKVKVTELFHLPLKISLDEYVFGPFLSSANGTQLNLGVYPGTDFQINTGVYLHELGHVLAAAHNPKLPAVLADLDNSVLFSETFADLLALSVHGEIITPDEAGSCLDRVRYISTFQSYNYPAEYFQNFSESRIRKCCESLVKTSTDSRYLNICEMAKEYFGPEVRMTRIFDPLETQNIDNHQIGVPILSFLKDLSQKSGESMAQIFGKIFFSGKEYSQEKFSCELKLQDTVLGTYKMGVHSATNMLNDLKQTLPESNLALFDSLYKKHALHKGMIFSEMDVAAGVREKLTQGLRKDPEIIKLCNGKIEKLQSQECYVECKSL